MKKKKIMIVEDDDDVREGLLLRMEASGYETLSAATAAEAVSTAKRETPDLMILDIGLPDGDAFTIVEKLGEDETLDAISVILITGRDPADFKDRAEEVGVKAFFLKPVDNKVLLQTMQQVLQDEESDEPSKAHQGSI